MLQCIERTEGREFYLLACISLAWNTTAQHKMHICDWLKLLLYTYLSICAYPFMLRWVLCIVNINNLLFTLCACCFTFSLHFHCVVLVFLVIQLKYCIWSRAHCFYSRHFVVCIIWHPWNSRSNRLVWSNESTFSYDDISISRVKKNERFQFDMHVYRLPVSIIKKQKTKIHQMKTIPIFDLTLMLRSFGFEQQIRCGHAARFLVFIAQLRVVAVYCVMLCLWNSTGLL